MNADDSNIIEQLMQIGMNQREAKLYFSLLKVNESTPAELNQVTDIQRTKIYEILEQMKARGFCTERREGKKKFFRAIRPNDIHEMLVQKWNMERQAQIEAQSKWEMDFEQRSRQTVGILVGLERLYESAVSDPATEMLEIIRSRKQIHLKFIQLMDNCEDEMLSFTRPPYSVSTEASRRDQLRANQEALARGVTQRTIYMVEDKLKETFLESIPDLKKAAEKSRFADELPIKMFIFDRSTVLLSLQYIPGLSGADFTMLTVRDSGIAEAFVTLFETYWKQAKTFEKWIEDTR